MWANDRVTDEGKSSTTIAIFFIVVERHQTGFDKLPLHTLVIDKKPKDIKVVQTISHINRIHPDKEDACFSDFLSKREEIQKMLSCFFIRISLIKQINIDHL